jgi:hypothetical protein
MALYFLSPIVHKSVLVFGNVVTSIIGACLIYSSLLLKESIAIPDTRVSLPANEFLATGAFLVLLGLHGFLAALRRVSWLLILYQCFTGAVIMVEMGVAVNGFILNFGITEESLESSQPLDEISPEVVKMCSMMSFTLVFIAIFQVILIWSAYNYYAFCNCFHRKQCYCLAKVNGKPQSPERYIGNVEAICVPNFTRCKLSPSCAMFTLQTQTPQFPGSELQANKLRFDDSVYDAHYSFDKTNSSNDFKCNEVPEIKIHAPKN